jgi:pSer/pThr/pTyr-binding forkhead associated (FHA) protein
MKLKLTLVSAGRENKLDLSKSPLIIGRTGADLTIDDKACSRQHALVVETPDKGLWLKDLNSTNGTKVNGKKVAETGLKVGDEIRIGETVLRITHYEGTGERGSITKVEESAVLKGWPDGFRALPKKQLSDFVDYIDEKGQKNSVRLSDLLKARDGKG